jgi:hypothetical protein
MENPGYNYTINNESIQKPATIVHLGITHHRNYRKTTSTQIQQNIEKSRRTLYSLLGAGLHGKNGLSPTACLHLLQVFVIPILTAFIPSCLSVISLSIEFDVLHILAYKLVYVSGFLSVSHLPGCKRQDLLYLLGLKVSALVFFDKIFPKFEAQF